MKKPPAEIVASLLAVTTLFAPANLPPWAIFISWAGTFAAGGPKPETLKKLWVTMPIGAITACLIVAGFHLASQYLSGSSFVLAQCVILFCLNGAMMSLGRIPALGFVPGMFFGFASYFATLFGGFGPAPGNLMVALGAAILMNAIGPAYAWLTANLGAHHHHVEEAAPIGRAQRVTS